MTKTIEINAAFRLFFCSSATDDGFPDLFASENEFLTKYGLRKGASQSPGSGLLAVEQTIQVPDFDALPQIIFDSRDIEKYCISEKVNIFDAKYRALQISCYDGIHRFSGREVFVLDLSQELQQEKALIAIEDKYSYFWAVGRCNNYFSEPHVLSPALEKIVSIYKS
jgi:hypothetical protein